MSTTTEPHDRGSRPAEFEAAGEVVRVRAPGDHLDARTAGQLVAPVAAAPPGATVVVDLSAVTHLSLEAAGTLMTLTRHCQAEGRTLRVAASDSARRKLALLGLDAVLPLQPPD
ncbi:STAS domain-containing protein [Amycolatopsis australiensis]|uniref:STAS domain-containing protein n=1 Tax=Amycolatopsis australiensis TaxID=546364 RepID=A0A1K1SMI3_9PSEU|nr:STAS domain-containing protein [Amycolatopsis australiensis]SFW85539.1 STAS domain-containing protein [Amycolatopsis australiensis]